MITHYDWKDGQEAMLRFGPPVGPVVLFAPPLFEEANRTRALLLSMARALADLSLASMIPDLPGTNESLIETEEATLSEWQAAFAVAAVSASRHGQVHIAAVRGGALLDKLASARSRWYLAPAAGESLVRDLMRARQIALATSGAHQSEDDDPIELAGNLVSQQMIAELRAASPLNPKLLRTIRLEDDPMPADRYVDGVPLWRRSEPGNDAVLAALLAADIEAWVRKCEK